MTDTLLEPVFLVRSEPTGLTAYGVTRNLLNNPRLYNFARKLEETRSRLDDRGNYHRNVSEATVEDVCARLRPSQRKSSRRFSDECG